MDDLLDQLLETTESLHESVCAFAPDQATDLLARRNQLTSLLQSALRHSSLTESQRGKLDRAIQRGAEARESLLIKRETSRGELQEKLAGRHLNRSFKPYRPKKLGTLNIKL